MPIEEAVTEALQRSGPCSLEHVATDLHNFSWGEVFLAVGRMSRNGQVLHLQLGGSTYLITLRAQFAQLDPATS